MLSSIVFFLPFVEVAYTQDNDGLPALRIENEFLKIIVLELKTVSQNLNKTFKAMETDLNEWKKMTVQMRYEKENLCIYMNNMSKNLNADVNSSSSRVRNNRHSLKATIIEKG